VPWYAKELPVRHCSCGRKATHEVFNAVNAAQGAFCSRCARQAVAAGNRDRPPRNAPEG
jgi:hypothetical protein